ncbi:MAG: TonB-dependent receptor [Lentisphaeria bacterium]|nr:TonB-dependent receptor [Lentisphaeria bacterium]
MKPLNKLLISSVAILGAYAVGDEPVDEQATKDQPAVEMKLPQTVVTATRTEVPLTAIGSSITVISRQDIENRNVNTVWDLLKTVPGVDFRQNGPNSNSSTMSIRGLNGYHTKVMIDGVAVQDTTALQTLPVLNILNTNDIERIEIIRGAASTLYGSNAMGGVVNIITRNASEALSGSLDAEFGSDHYQRYAGNLSGTGRMFDFSLGGQWLSDGGISAQKTPMLNNDVDSFRETSLFGKFGLAIDEKTRVEVFGRFSDSDQEYDSGVAASSFTWGGVTYVNPATPDSGDVHVITWSGGTTITHKEMLDGLWDTKLSLAYSEYMRNYRDDFGISTADRYIGKTIEGKWQNDLYLTEWSTVTVGYDYTEERAKLEDGAFFSPSPKVDDACRTHSPYAQLQLEPIENLFATAGIRYNDHSAFGDETTYSASLAYFVEKTQTKLKTNWGTGYRAPSISELYGWWGANPNLKPEESESWDIGFEQSIGPKMTLGATYFQNRVTNYIGWNGAGYNQIAGIKIHGMEAFVTCKVLKSLAVTATYTRQHANNMQQDEASLPYIPEDKISLTADFQATEKLNVNLTGIYVGQRTTDVAGANDIHGYTLLNLAASYQLTKTCDIYGRIHNLLDQDYEENAGYNTRGISLYAGVKASF